MDAIVVTSGGQVKGRTDGEVTAFLGIPYAAAPLGEKAYQAPEPVTWDGVRDATALGATIPQPGYEPPYDGLLANPGIPGPDTLNVNVWTPGGSGLPVLVWIHGGAFRNGSNAVPEYDGTAFARDGVVLVGVNYRLGIQGFGVVPGAPSNRGLLDQVAALQWVQENIAAFGGDPDRVTIAGESAGGMSVATLLSIPAAKGLFRRAIVQSGSAGVAALETDAGAVAAEVAKRLGVEYSAAGLASVSIEDLLAAQRAVAIEMRLKPDPTRWGASTIAVGGGIMPVMPVIDNKLIFEVPIDAIARGSAEGVDVLVGSTSDEFSFFTVPSGLAATITPEVLTPALAGMGVPPEITAAYIAGRPDQSPGEILNAVVTDSIFTVPSIQLAAAQGPHGTPYLYEFAWKSPLEGVGACHSLELAFMFDTLGTAKSPLYGGVAPQELADTMHGVWVTFAATGDPGWPAYEASTRAVMTFDHPTSELKSAPRADELAVWGV
ncbi:carboxylesterase/lipase family protein [Kribbella antibiotica]|uniref:Carboxylic ester hydrolase n=1 Tax=Kribbella antibiotica TaxID=190195 RepID=A0A4R4ZUS4_9ACTN|nr:carboxylesterase family protein [Kribbella antibiotica]TDD62911.1 carboxylesterase/lipase family protein [Kribbella antibiotica]